MHNRENKSEDQDASFHPTCYGRVVVCSSASTDRMQQTCGCAIINRRSHLRAQQAASKRRICAPHRLSSCCAVILLLPVLAGIPSGKGQSTKVLQCHSVRFERPQEGADPHSASTESAEPQGLIHLDVVVKDGKGKLVSDLRKNDFRVLDNGHEQKIISFHAYSKDALPDPPSSVFLVLDGLGGPPGLEYAENEQVLKFLRQNGGRLSQPLTVLKLAPTGLWQVGEPSSDGNALAERLVHNHLTPLVSQQTTSQHELTSNLFVPGRQADGPALTALKMLGVVATAERRKPGRKLLIWVGLGWGMGSGNNPEDVVGSRQVLFDRIVWFSNLLRVARINLYCLPVGTINTAADESAMHIHGPLDMPPMVSAPLNISSAPASPKEADEVYLNRETLALASGGRVFKPSVDLVSQINECLEEASTFYTLSFDPATAEHTDEYHNLEVKVPAAELEARTNAGYFDQPYYSDRNDPAVHRVTVSDLDQFLRADHNRSDQEIAAELSNLELRERASDSLLESWISRLRGKKAREALVLLVDSSMFEDPPRAIIPADAAPDEIVQRKMLTLAAEYLNNTIPRLPDFYARRTLSRYRQFPPHYEGNGRTDPGKPLHLVDTSTATVLYRNGLELLDTKTPRRGKDDPQLVTYGTFGPVLKAVRDAIASPRGLRWKHWEEASGERRAVFSFAVPALDSQYEVGGCCLPDDDSSRPFNKMTGYHGEIEINPDSGVVLRVQLQADLDGFLPLSRSAVMVSYGAVQIGGKSYACPLHSVAIWRARSVDTFSEWNESFNMWGAYATQIGDMRFENYHMFRSSSRVVGDFTPLPQ